MTLRQLIDAWNDVALKRLWLDSDHGGEGRIYVARRDVEPGAIEVDSIVLAMLDVLNIQSDEEHERLLDQFGGGGSRELLTTMGQGSEEDLVAWEDASGSAGASLQSVDVAGFGYVYYFADDEPDLVLGAWVPGHDETLFRELFVRVYAEGVQGTLTIAFPPGGPGVSRASVSPLLPPHVVIRSIQDGLGKSPDLWSYILNDLDTERRPAVSEVAESFGISEEKANELIVGAIGPIDVGHVQHLSRHERDVVIWTYARTIGFA